MTIATVLAAGLLPVIPQPTQWMPSKGTCDIATANVSVAMCADSALGEEGYTMKIAPSGIKIVAGGETGRVWAWQTIAQLKAAGAKAPCGDIRDVPKYRLRGFVIDVARMFHSMDFLRDLARTMSYYKMNLLHVHLNDNEIAPKNKPDVDWSKMYAAFRMECETYPGLTAKDGHYTKKEFREFMLFCKSIGVTVVPEFDVPAHALAFTRVRPEFASAEYGADHFDLSKSDQILAWLKPLFAEYMTGAEPVFAGPYMHVGTDEYNKKEAERFRAFTDAMLKMVADVMMDIWYNPYYQPAEALDAGYTIVSVPDGLVYIVPYAGYYYDYLNCKYLYESWEPRRVGNYTVPDGYMDKLAGGKFALWNDRLGKKKNGERYAESDNWDRIYPALQTLSQKMWTGMRTDQTWEQFAALADAKREPEGVKSRHKTTLSK